MRTIGSPDLRDLEEKVVEVDLVVVGLQGRQYAVDIRLGDLGVDVTEVLVQGGAVDALVVLAVQQDKYL